MRRAIRASCEANSKYALSLVRDLHDAQMVAQPVAGVTMNHPAWVLAHLNVYAPIALAMLRGEPFDDPADHRYGRNSKVVNDAGEYPRREELIAEYERTHAEVLSTLDSAHDSVFSAPTPLERWRASKPTVGEILIELLGRHEALHLGQFSAWRRVMGFPPV